jgi:hypothetical protein
MTSTDFAFASYPVRKIFDPHHTGDECPAGSAVFQAALSGRNRTETAGSLGSVPAAAGPRKRGHDSGTFPSHSVYNGCRIRRRANVHAQLRPRPHAVDSRLRRMAQIAIAGVLNDADDIEFEFDTVGVQPAPYMI